MAAALASGFDDPVFDPQRTFRAVMDALARPGSLQDLTTGLAPPTPLTPELAGVALTLADHESALWLDAALAAEPAVAAFLRFHTGAPIVADAAEAVFALVTDAEALPPFDGFAQGSDEYPDRSATIVLAVDTLSNEGGFRLSGPGIEDEATLRATPLPADMAARLRANGARFPRGVDLLFVAPGRVAGVPRSTRIGGS